MKLFRKKSEKDSGFAVQSAVRENFSQSFPDSGIDYCEKELYDKLSDEEKVKYTELSFTITSVDEKEGLIEYRNGLDEQVVVIFTKA